MTKKTEVEKTKVDMSGAAVSARLRRACGLGDSERLATMIRSASAEIESAKATYRQKTPKQERH
jgi:hypothetical protein